MTVSARRQEFIFVALGLIFGWLGAISLWFQSHESFILIAMAALSGCGLAAHWWLNRIAPARDPFLLPISLSLTAWGFIVGARVASNFLPRQLVWMVIGLIALCAVATSRSRLRWLRRFKYTWLLASLLLLAATLILGVNPTGAGARLWLSVAGIFVQPSEVLRLLMVAFLAAFFSERLAIGHWSLPSSGETWQFHFKGRALPDIWRSFAPLAPSFVMWMVALALLGTQQDLGAAALLLITYTFMLYLATGQALLPALGFGMLLITGVLGYYLSSRVALRVDIWLNPWLDPRGASFQIVQSLIAVANGGILGQGPGQGRPDYVPAVHTDFPFAAIGEEYGLIGALAVLALFSVLALRAWRLARTSQSAYSMLLAGGIAALLSTQVFVIIGGNLGLLPLTGVTLPFISYGGSSLLVSYVAVGLLIRLSSDLKAGLYPVKGMQENGKSTTYHAGNTVRQVLPAQRTAARNGMLVCAGLFILLSLTAGYWATVQRDSLTTRSDNPRNVDAERIIDRGTILARDGTILVISQIQPVQAPYLTPNYVRHYAYPDTAPIVGYYSIRHGVGGIEAYADTRLRGKSSELDRLLHHVQSGEAFTTTVDLAQQRKLSDVLSGTIGSGLIMDWRTGEVLALVSNPTYNPNTLDDNYDNLLARADAPLINRATQGLYQPGALLTRIYSGGKDATSGSSTSVKSWDGTDRYHLGQPVPFELENASIPYPVTAAYTETLGQGTLRLSPLRVAVTAATLAAGAPVTPTLTYLPVNAKAIDVAPQIITTFQVIAQTSQKTHVGWYVNIDRSRVTVLAVEMTRLDTELLDRVIRRLGNAPSSANHNQQGVYPRKARF